MANALILSLLSADVAKDNKSANAVKNEFSCFYRFIIIHWTICLFVYYLEPGFHALKIMCYVFSFFSLRIASNASGYNSMAFS